MTNHICDRCFAPFVSLKSNAKYCSSACRAAAKKQRRIAIAATVVDPAAICRECSVCGDKKPLTAFYKSVSGWLGYGTECKVCCDKRKMIERQTPEGRFSRAKAIAKNRGIMWSLTLEEYLALVAERCHYCGGKLPRTCGGLDRKDNDKAIGYRIDNVVPCCLRCNRVKGDHFTYEEMMTLKNKIRLIEVNRRIHVFQPGELPVCQ